MGAVIGILMQASAVAAAPVRIAVLGPKDSPLVTRLQRNLSDPPSLLATSVVTTCSRYVVAKMLYNLDAGIAICSDGDTVTVWRVDGEGVAIIEAAPIVETDDRSLELLAARVTIAARKGTRAPTAATIVANTDDGDAAWVMANASRPSSLPYEPPTADALLTRETQREPVRKAPRAIFSAGPAFYGSSGGSVAALSVRAELGVARGVTFVPWAMIPGARDASAVYGTASYRPTLFGLGFGIPLRDNSKTLVPRIGAGYALLWMHVWPESAAPGSTKGESENLFAPCMYIDTALSVGINKTFRIVGDAMLGTSTHKMVVRIGEIHAATWGAPLASLALRGEVVFQ